MNSYLWFQHEVVNAYVNSVLGFAAVILFIRALTQGATGARTGAACFSLSLLFILFWGINSQADESEFGLTNVFCQNSTPISAAPPLDTLTNGSTEYWRALEAHRRFAETLWRCQQSFLVVPDLRAPYFAFVAFLIGLIPACRFIRSKHSVALILSALAFFLMYGLLIPYCIFGLLISAEII